MAQEKLPPVFQTIIDRYPQVAAAHEAMAQAVDACGPLDAKTCSLIKIGISVGAGLESAVRSHTRRAIQAGATRDEVVQAIFQGMNTVGFPRTVAAWSWAQVQFERITLVVCTAATNRHLSTSTSVWWPFFPVVVPVALVATRR